MTMIQQSEFLSLKRGDIIELPADQRRTIDCPANPAESPWNQVVTVTVAWLDGLSGRMTFFADAKDIISVGEKPPLATTHPGDRQP
jgi:hypothetical protein